jgi:hypothetical protein
VNNLLGRFDFVQFQCVRLKNMAKKVHTTVAKSDVERFIRGMGRGGGGGGGEEPCVSDMFSIPELGRKDTRAARSPPWALDSLHPCILTDISLNFGMNLEMHGNIIKNINLLKFRTCLICKPVAIRSYVSVSLFPSINMSLFVTLSVPEHVSASSLSLFFSVSVSVGVSVSGCVHCASI